MKYISTRSNLNPKDFSDIIISGTDELGGLYIPEKLPFLAKEILNQDLDYVELATKVISLFANDISREKIHQCCIKAYSNFKDDIAPLKNLEKNLYMLELFQGPTLSFKDYAMQFLGQVVNLVLEEKNLKKQIITATSGDTGPAAIYGFKDCELIDIKVYYPKNGISKFQEDQMIRVKQDNVELLAMDLDFDECQKIVKKEFENYNPNLMTVNSINIARIISQIIYYLFTYKKLGQKEIEFFVPTGNFGNVFAGFLATKLGMKAKFAICVNENDTLYRFYNSGIYEPKTVKKTTSNAIDISNPSNFERILWYLSDDKKDVLKYMQDLKDHGKYQVSKEFLDKFKEIFTVYKVSESEVFEVQKSIEEKHNLKICPHSALALKPALNQENLRVCLATASYLKF